MIKEHNTLVPVKPVPFVPTPFYHGMPIKFTPSTTAMVNIVDKGKVVATVPMNRKQRRSIKVRNGGYHG